MKKNGLLISGHKDVKSPLLCTELLIIKLVNTQITKQIIEQRTPEPLWIKTRNSNCDREGYEFSHLGRVIRPLALHLGVSLR